MAEPEDMIVPMLREMREEVRRGFEEVDQRFKAIETRFDARFDGIDGRLRTLEKLVRAQREAFEGESILGRYAAKEVEERLAELERKVAALESRS